VTKLKKGESKMKQKTQFGEWATKENINSAVGKFIATIACFMQEAGGAVGVGTVESLPFAEIVRIALQNRIFFSVRSPYHSFPESYDILRDSGDYEIEERVGQEEEAYHIKFSDVGGTRWGE